MELPASVWGLEGGSSGVKGRRTAAAGGTASCLEGRGSVWLWEAGRGRRPGGGAGADEADEAGLALGKVPVWRPGPLPYGAPLGPLGLVGTGGGTLTGGLEAWGRRQAHGGGGV
ncbi:hypothetical protein CRUP_016794 [Coryphaenoides rupestris]|nr:hypothetical protein CRUP_016794 [Coryphaenoides rupestris]